MGIPRRFDIVILYSAMDHCCVTRKVSCAAGLPGEAGGGSLELVLTKYLPVGFAGAALALLP